MKKRTYLAGSLLTGLALGLLGCDKNEMKSSVETDQPLIKPGPAYEPGPVQPSPIPSLPPTGPTATSAASEGKMEPVKSEPKKEEPKP